MSVTTNYIAGINETTTAFFNQLIDAVMTSERRPIVLLEQQKSQINGLVQAYTALTSRFTALNTALTNLRAGSATWGQKSATVGNKSDAAATILTASASSSAVEGTYEIVVTALAKAHRAASDQQASSTEALGLEGTFAIGSGEDETLITITAEQSLNDIVKTINSASYAAGSAVSATVVDRRLVITAKDTGAAHAIRIRDVEGTVLSGTGGDGLGLIIGDDVFKNTGAGDGYQAAADAAFTVNGLPMTRSGNSSLTDVISGVTLNLAADAEGKSARLTVAANTETAQTRINEFITAFNALQKDIKEATAARVSGTGQDAVYTRNALAGDSVLGRLRSSLYALFGRSVDVGDGTSLSMRELGITLDASMTVRVSDAAKLREALTENPQRVEAFFDAVADALQQALTPYVGSQGIINRQISTANSRLTSINQRISVLEERLEWRREKLQKEYGHLMTQMAQMSYTQRRLNAYWGQ